MTETTIDGGIVEMADAYGQAFEAAGLPPVEDRGAVTLGRFSAIEGEPRHHFQLMGGGDVGAGARLSASAFVHGMSFADSFLVVDMEKGNGFRKACGDAAARALFAHDWATAMEDAGRGAELSGQRIEDIAPETPHGYLQAARYLIGLVEGANLATVEALYDRAVAAQFPEIGDRAQAIGSERLNPTRFAETLVLEAIGTGVSWTDDATPFEIEIPSVELAMDPIEVEPVAAPVR